MWSFTDIYVAPFPHSLLREGSPNIAGPSITNLVARAYLVYLKSRTGVPLSANIPRDQFAFLSLSPLN